MIEILLFGLSSNRGGIETYLYKIWNHIDRERFHFNFIDMTGEGRRPCFYQELKESGCSFYKVTPRNVSIRKNREDIRRLFRDQRFDIFHFNVNTLSYLLPVVSALKSGCKVIVHSRSAGNMENSVITKQLHNINKRRLRYMKVTRIAVSRKAGEWLFGNSHFEVFHNGVKTEDFVFCQEDRDRVRQIFGCEGKTVIGSVAAFIPVKNHAFMVNVFEEYLKLNPNAVLWFVGDGPLKCEIEELVRRKRLEKNIICLGSCKNMKELYAGMDMLWLPSLTEGYPNVMLEAQCEGLPCLISDCIPQDTRIMENTFSFGLDQPLSAWATMIEKTVRAQHINRKDCWREMEARGASVKDEIRRIEQLYKTIVFE